MPRAPINLRLQLNISNLGTIRETEEVFNPLPRRLVDRTEGPFSSQKSPPERDFIRGKRGKQP